jgi:hypothetical protein
MINLSLNGSFSLILSLLLFGCTNDKFEKETGGKINTDTTNYGAIDSKDDSFRNAFFLNIDEPLLKDAEIETYRFMWGRIFNNDYILRIEKSSDSNIHLISKCFLEGFPGSKRMYKGKQVDTGTDTIVESTNQRITINQWNSFKEILEGSYYWALNIPCRYGTGYLDADVLILESKSDVCIADTLSYHLVAIEVPKKGNFRDAFKKLLQLSNLTKDDKSILKELE